MISVIIPTLNGARLLPALVGSLRRQTVKDVEIVVIDSESEDGTGRVAAALGCLVSTTSRKSFDHGGVRNLGARRATGDVLAFLTQDARPVSSDYLERLTAPIDSRVAAAAYARQVPASNAKPTEVFTRLYNYPPESSLRHISRVERRTLRAFFFSNAASAVSRACFDAVGGFPAPVPTNEDMLLCARLLDAGYQIAYVAEAEVVHSHDFSMGELFRRYYRMGAVIRQHRETLRSVRHAGEGYDFVRQQVAHLKRIGRQELIPLAFAEAGVKALAYHCGHALSALRN